MFEKRLLFPSFTRNYDKPYVWLTGSRNSPMCGGTKVNMTKQTASARSRRPKTTEAHEAEYSFGGLLSFLF